MATKSPKKAQDQRIAEQLIAAMESGEMKWRRPWNQARCRQQNLITGHRYTGSNLALTEIISASYGWQSLWLTFANARTNGLTVEKGSKATYLLKPVTVKTETVDDDGNVVKAGFTTFSAFAVFNASQITPCEKLDQLIEKALNANGQQLLAEPERLQKAEDLLTEWPVQPQFGGDKACYNPAADQIHLPLRKQFHSAESLYSTWAHEVIHSTGHKDRLDRKLSTYFGSADYAKEELIAELGSVLLCSQMEIGYEVESHASYLQNWVEILKEEPRFVLQALGQARRAADLVTDR
jgi:antirestriction protein ArdC